MPNVKKTIKEERKQSSGVLLCMIHFFQIFTRLSFELRTPKEFLEIFFKSCLMFDYVLIMFDYVGLLLYSNNLYWSFGSCDLLDYATFKPAFTSLQQCHRVNPDPKGATSGNRRDKFWSNMSSQKCNKLMPPILHRK